MPAKRHPHAETHQHLDLSHAHEGTKKPGTFHVGASRVKPTPVKGGDVRYVHAMDKHGMVDRMDMPEREKKSAKMAKHAKPAKKGHATKKPGKRSGSY